MIISYVLFNVLNVIIQTIKSIVTIKCNKYIASVVNAVAYGLYTYIIILTSIDIELWVKIAVVALANLIGVFIVKAIEEKRRKSMLWKIEFTVNGALADAVDELLKLARVPHNYIDKVGRYTIFNAYCATEKESESVKEIIKKYNAKYFVSETKIL